MNQILASKVVFIFVSLLAFIKPVKAQIIPDQSLIQNTISQPGCNNCNITGGTQVGNNLFHSFEQFSIPKNGSANFNNSSSVFNIINRVTGIFPSQIDGLIKANGNANIFLINPNGIIFGEGAKLDIGGSFIATTASSLQFGNLGFYSAVNPNSPSPLLTINPSVFFFNQIGQPVQVNGNLSVPANQSILLVGGDVSINNAKLQAPGGKIELAGIATNGNIGLGIENNQFSLIPSDSERANISLTNNAKVDVVGNGSGSVTLTGRNLQMTQGSTINAGIEQQLTGVSSPGNINLSITDKLQISGGSIVANTANFRSRSKAGNININAGNVEVNGGIIRTRTSGEGDAGDINIQAGDIYINNPAYKIPGRDNRLEDKPAIDASNYTNDAINSGKGKSGNISLISRNSITLIGQGIDEENKVISTYNRSGGNGGGGISLIANGTIFFDNAYLVTSSFSKNGAGSVTLQGDKSISLTNNSAINSISFLSGNSGNISLLSQGPILLQTSKINTQVANDVPLNNQGILGNAGSITISGQSVKIKDGTEVKSSSFAGINSGEIKITAPEFIEISGNGPFPIPVGYRPRNYIYTSVTSSNEERSTGNGGSIFISTNTLRLAQGAHIRANTRSPGSGGNITVDANVLEATGGGEIITTTSGKGDAGNITLNIKDRINISGSNPKYDQDFQQVVATILKDSQDDKIPKNEAQARSEAAITIGSISSSSGIFANASSLSTGKGGNLTINTNNIQVRDNGKLTVASEGLGSAGNANINAKTFTLDSSTLTADTRGTNSDLDSEQATINIQAQDLFLFRGSKISTNASGANVIGGNINIKTNTLVALQNSDISANSSNFRGGRISVDAEGIVGTEFRDNLTNQSDITATGASPELSGTVEIKPIDDPTRGLLQLPEGLKDQSDQFDQLCGENGKPLGRFVITGKQGTLPTNPTNLMQGGIISTPLATLDGSNSLGKVNSIPDSLTVQNPPQNRIVEAQAIIKGADGTLYLVAEAPNVTPYSRPTVSVCANVRR